MPLRALALWVVVAFALAAAPSPAKDTIVAPYYLTAGDVDLGLLLAPPPDLNSPLQQYDEKKIAEVLAERTPSDVAQALADAHRSIFVFSDALGNTFTADRIPLTNALFAHVDADTETLIGQAKAHFDRPRLPDAPQIRTARIPADTRPSRPVRRFCSGKWSPKSAAPFSLAPASLRKAASSPGFTTRATSRPDGFRAP